LFGIPNRSLEGRPPHASRNRAPESSSAKFVQRADGFRDF
jgi:hypothetical protein